MDICIKPPSSSVSQDCPRLLKHNAIPHLHHSRPLNLGIANSNAKRGQAGNATRRVAVRQQMAMNRLPLCPGDYTVLLPTGDSSVTRLQWGTSTVHVPFGQKPEIHAFEMHLHPTPPHFQFKASSNQILRRSN